MKEALNSLCFGENAILRKTNEKEDGFSNDEPIRLNRLFESNSLKVNMLYD